MSVLSGPTSILEYDRVFLLSKLGSHTRGYTAVGSDPLDVVSHSAELMLEAVFDRITSNGHALEIGLFLSTDQARRSQQAHLARHPARNADLGQLAIVAHKVAEVHKSEKSNRCENKKSSKKIKKLSTDDVDMDDGSRKA